jgi:predicted transposase YbfD/YdcC
VGEEPIAIGGKTLRGSKKQGAPGALLLSAWAHRVGVTLAPQAVDDKPNEMPIGWDLLRHRVLEGRIVTMDALLPQRQIAQHIGAARGDYVMVVKENQAQLLDDSETVFALPPMPGERRTAAATLDLGHGRIEQRGLRTSDVLAGDSDWPGLAQGFQLERQVIIKKTGEVRTEVVAGVTSLAPERADAARLLALVHNQATFLGMARGVSRSHP